MTPCDSHALRKQSETVHTYNAHGRREIMFSAHANACVGGGPTGTLFASFDVAPGASSGQGPALPKVRFDTTVRPPEIANDVSYVTVGGMVTDDDGFVGKLVLDWGGRYAGADPSGGRDRMPAQRERLAAPEHGVDPEQSRGHAPLRRGRRLPGDPHRDLHRV